MTFHSSTFQSAFQEQQQNNTEKTERQANFLQRSHTVISNVKNPPKYKFAHDDFTSFSMEVSSNSYNFRFRSPALHIQDLWNRCIHKYNPTISRMFWNSFLAFFFNLVQLCAVKWKAAILVGASRPWSLSVVHSRVFLWRRSCFFTKKMEDSQNFSNFYQNLWKESTKDLIKQWIKPLSWLSINYLTEKNWYERVSCLNSCFIAPKTRFFPEKKKRFPEFLAISIKTLGKNQLKAW